MVGTKKVEEKKKIKKEMYGLDADFLEDLGLDFSDLEENEEADPSENMTYEDLR